MIKFIEKHFLSLNRILENKLLLNTIYLIILIIIFTISIIILIFLKKSHFPFLIDSIFLELLSWLMPTIIIIFLSIYTIKSCIFLNPLNNVYLNLKQLTIELISINWKWLFFFPTQKIVTINEICLPILVPIKIILISNSLMNSFCVPKIGYQLYCMNNCIKSIKFILLKHGFCHGNSSNYDGIGYQFMRINIFSVNKKSFFYWIKKIKKSKIFKLNDFNHIIKEGFIKFSKFFNLINNKIFFLNINNK